MENDKSLSDEFNDLFSEKQVINLAEYILEHFSNGEGKEIDYDFSLSGGVMKKSKNSNLSFKFDTLPDTLPRRIRDLLSNEKLEATKERGDKVIGFLSSVGKILLGKYKSELSEKIRKGVFGPDVDSTQLPMNDIRFIALDITDLPNDDSVVVIKKAIPANAQNDPDFVHPEAVSGELYQIAAKTGETLEAVIERKKAEGDPKYKYIQGLERRKYFYECQLDLAVDFTFVPAV